MRAWRQISFMGVVFSFLSGSFALSQAVDGAPQIKTEEVTLQQAYDAIGVSPKTSSDQGATVQGTKIGDILLPDPKKKISEEWEKARLKFDGKIVGWSFPIENLLNFSGLIQYQYRVEPAFSKDLQQRLDIYLVNINTGIPLGNIVGANLQIGAQVSFSRVFRGKTTAATAPIYFLNKIPWESDRAIKELIPGDAVRIEFTSDGSLNVNAQLLSGVFRGYFGVNFGRGARFVTDIYRLKDNHVRVRLLANRNSGTFGANGGVDIIGNLDPIFGLAGPILNGLIKCSPVHLQGSKSFQSFLPVDTYMLDYFIDLNSPEGAEAFNRIMRGVRDMDYIRQLDLFTNDAFLGRQLLDVADGAEQQFLFDRLLPSKERKVDRIFKGYTTSGFGAFALGSSCSFVWSAERSLFNTGTNVRFYDERDFPQEYIYLGSQHRERSSAFFGMRGADYDRSINGLISSVDSGSKNHVALAPVALSDVIFSTNSKEKTLERDKFLRTKNYLEYTLSPAAQKINFGKFEERRTSTNAYFKYYFVFHRDALHSLPIMSKEEVFREFKKYVDEFPEKDSLLSDFIEDTWSGQFLAEQEIQFIAEKLSIIFNSPSPDHRMEAFASIKSSPLFQRVGPGFFLKLLPQEDLQDLVYFHLLAGADEEGGIEYIYGRNGISRLFRSIEYILAMINDRAFDLRLIIENGEFDLEKSKQDLKSRCEECEALGTEP